MSLHRISAGGSATATGIDFQSRVAAIFAVNILAEQGVSLDWGLPPHVSLESIRLETEQPIDDILLITSDQGKIYIQVKHSLSLARGLNSALASCIDQCVRQYVMGLSQNDMEVDPSRDRFIIVTSPKSSKPIKEIVPNVLEKIRANGTNDTLVNVSQSELEIYTVLTQHANSSWKQVAGALPTDYEIKKLFSLVYFKVIDADKDGSDESQAQQILRSSILKTPSDVDAAWNILIQACTNLSRLRSGSDRVGLQKIPIESGISIYGPISYKEDVVALLGQTDTTLRLLRDLSFIKIGAQEIKILRESSDALQKTTIDTSIVVVGDPGSGKSGVLFELAKNLRNNEFDVVFLAVDKLSAKSFGDLRNEIGLKHDLIDIICQWPGTKSGYLIIDALDAARDTSSGQLFRDLLSQVSATGSRWKIIASIRKFDLRYSKDLQTLFAGNPPTPFIDESFNQICHINIPVFSDLELERAKEQSLQIKQLIENANSTLQELLHLPFNLKIAAELLGSGIDLNRLLPIKTQIGLLDRYWTHRIIKNDGYRDARERVLKLVVDKMVDERSLRVDRTRILGEPNLSPYLIDLLSSNVLCEWQPNPAMIPSEYIITFAHNMLFDYAVSRILFRGSPNHIVDRLVNDPEIILAIRPSIVFHLQYIWDNDPSRDSYWDLVLQIIGNKNIREVGKLIGPALAADLSTNLSDFVRLLERLSDNPQNRVDIVKALQHISGAIIAKAQDNERSIIGQNAGPWCELTERMSSYLDDRIAYIVRFMVVKLTEDPDSLTLEQLSAIGLASRRLLIFARSVGKDKRDPNLISYAIRAVCRSFPSDIEESSRLIRQALNKENLVQSGYLDMPTIANEILFVLHHAPNLVEDIYVSVFLYHEERTDARPLGSQLLRMTSNIKQDYHMAEWRLGEIYDKFLWQAPVYATRALIKIIDEYVRDKHSKEFEDEITFDFAGRSVRFSSDYSAIWNSGDVYNDDAPLKMLRIFSRYFDEVLSCEGDQSNLTEVVDVILENNRAAVIWNLLLEKGAKAPFTIGYQLRPLIWAEPILTEYDTSTNAGNFLGVIYPLLSEFEREKIEVLILSIPEKNSDVATRFNIQVRNRLLGCIPSELLVTKRAIEVIRELHELDAVPKNTPPFHFEGFTSHQFTEEDYLKEKGVAIGDASNLQIRTLYLPLKSFVEAHANRIPTLLEASAISPQLEKLIIELTNAERDNVHEDVREFGWGYLIQTCEEIVRNDEISCMSDIGEFVKSLLIAASHHPNPMPDPQQEAQFSDFLSWGSPSPRIDSAIGLMLLGRIASCIDEALINAIQRLSKDPVPAVRYQIASRANALVNTAPDIMWHLLDRYSKEEMNLGVLQGIVHGPFYRLATDYSENVVALTLKIFERIVENRKATDIRHTCATIWLNLYLWQDNLICRESLNNIINKADDLDLITHIVFQLQDKLAISDLVGQEKVSAGIREKSLELLLMCTNLVTQRIKEFEAFNDPKFTPSEEQNELIQKHYYLVERIALTIYFASGAFEEKESIETRSRILSIDEKIRLLNTLDSIILRLADLSIPGVTDDLVKTVDSLAVADPAKSFLLMADIVRAGKLGGYQFESLAAERIVAFVERYLAEHRVLLRENSDCQKALLDLLDIFVEAGWSSARRLTYRLEEIYR
jgi:hypothetical protein